VPACVHTCTRAWIHAHTRGDARERADRTKRTHVLHASACTVRARAPFTPIAVLMHDRGSAGSNVAQRRGSESDRATASPAAPSPARGTRKISLIVPPPPAGSVLSSRAETRENSVETVASEQRTERELRLTAKVARQRRGGRRRPGAEIAGCGLRVTNA